jgi:hypothetical protein
MGKEIMIARMVALLLQVLTPAKVKDLVDQLLDNVEAAVINSPATMDDVVVLPLCVIIRQALAVPDNHVSAGGGEKPAA